MNTSNTIPVPLYHGTDKKIIGYSEKERAEIQELCVAISEYLYHLVSEDGLSIYSPSRYKSKRLAEIGDYWYHFIDSSNASTFPRIPRHKAKETISIGTILHKPATALMSLPSVALYPS